MIRLALILIAVVIVFGLGISACTGSKSGARNTMLDQGFSNVQVTGRDWWYELHCGQDYTAAWNATATNINHRPVHVVVCQKWFGGSVVKFR